MARPLGDLDTQLLVGDLYMIMPFKISVTYFVSNNNVGGFAGGRRVNDVESPRPRAKGLREFSPAALTVQTRAFFMWTDKLGDIEPKPGDKFTDEKSRTWKVQEVSEELGGQRWKLECTRHQS